MSLDRIIPELGWPSRQEIFSPTGAGPRVMAQLAQEKIGQALSHLLSEAHGVNIGILASDPDATQAPLALICEFPRRVSQQTLEAAHKFAWNFGRAPLLITVEPNQLRTWSCCELPVDARGGQRDADHGTGPELGTAISLENQGTSLLADRIAASLQWVDLLSGKFFETHSERFPSDTRADQSLLHNLQDVRTKLKEMGLDDDTSHDLLARIIFIQFLFDRQDQDGRAALDEKELRHLQMEGVLSRAFTGLSDILSSYSDTYSLFQWLNTKFNGDLFPGKGSSAEQEAAWKAEQERVRPEHLQLLARFVGGSETLRNGQMSLWPHYSFDAVPLEFISTIYETFVDKKKGRGVHYTRPYVVDLILDGVLPWAGDDWQVSVLDPACGSGIFLVKAYQRLIHRWENANPGQPIPSAVLEGLLQNHIFGVDIDSHAIRTASFSLYLAMCDKINPRDYWKDVHFPSLRGDRLIDADFFREDSQGIRTGEAEYDLVVGNPPWGKNSVTKFAHDWAANKAHDWPISYGDIGPLFLAKGLALTKPGGRVGMLQPASMLYKTGEPSRQFLAQLFNETDVEEVINFAPFRKILFRDAKDPVCAFIVHKTSPSGEPFWYTTPKPLHTHDDDYRIVIEPHDVHPVWPEEVIMFPHVWSALLWGGRRDLALLKRHSNNNNVFHLEKDKNIKAIQGLKRSTTGSTLNGILNRPLLESENFPENFIPILDASSLPINQNPYAHRNTNLAAFNLPQLILSKSWHTNTLRFGAVRVASNERVGGVICSETFFSIHAEPGDENVLDAICLVFNSSFAVYYLLLTSGRFAMNRAEAEAEAIRHVPLPEPRPGLMDRVTTSDQVDQRVREAFGFQEAEWLLIEDLFAYTLPDYKGDFGSAGRKPTRRRPKTEGGLVDEPELTAYCETFLKVLRAAYGGDKQIGAVVYTEPPTEDNLPVRLVTICLNDPRRDGVNREPIQSVILRDRLTHLYQKMLSSEDNPGVYYQRAARFYETETIDEGQTAILLHLIKPDQTRYWLRSRALQDADEVVLDMMTWRESAAIHKQEVPLG